jgi:membrane fusion protein, multidrug efflux system
MTTPYRRLIILLSAAVFIGGMVGYQALSRQKEPPPRKPGGEGLRIRLEATVASNGILPVPVPLQGRIIATEKVDLFAEVNGLFLRSAHPFREGVRFRQGELLAGLDDREARLALQGQRASLLTGMAQALPDIRIEFPDRFEVWEYWVRGLDPEKTLTDLPVPATDRERYFLAARNIQGQFYAIRSAEERLTKYRLIAPFDGTLTAVDVRTGTLVRPGQRLGSFLRLGGFELETNVPLSDLKFIGIGQEVRLTSEDTGEAYRGKVGRIGDQIDPATQMVPVYISLNGGGLREGMYLRGSVQGLPAPGVLVLPKDLLINGKEIWAIRDSTLLRLPVELVRNTREEVILRGIPDGTLMVSRVIPGMYEGMQVSWSTP